jgi:hypothetical protein
MASFVVQAALTAQPITITPAAAAAAAGARARYPSPRCCCCAPQATLYGWWYVQRSTVPTICEKFSRENVP